jgi:hypothetical protein
LEAIGMCTTVPHLQPNLRMTPIGWFSIAHWVELNLR